MARARRERSGGSIAAASMRRTSRAWSRKAPAIEAHSSTTDCAHDDHGLLGGALSSVLDLRRRSTTGRTWPHREVGPPMKAGAQAMRGVSWRPAVSPTSRVSGPVSSPDRWRVLWLPARAQPTLGDAGESLTGGAALVTGGPRRCLTAGRHPRGGPAVSRGAPSVPLGSASWRTAHRIRGGGPWPAAGTLETLRPAVDVESTGLRLAQRRAKWCTGLPRPPVCLEGAAR